MVAIHIPVVQAENLCKHYGELKAVDGVSFNVQRGECFGILGPNGAGKTTTMKMLYGVAIPTAGHLRVLDFDVLQEIRQLKSHLGVIAQENNLDPDLTVRENLVIFARYFGITGREAQRRADELLGFSDLTEKAKVRVDKLSGGMKRKLMIVRGLIHHPKLLILDEPTTGLDPGARLGIWKLLKNLQQEEQVTLMLTTHYMEEAQRLCDRLVFMDRGKIICEGRPDEVVQKQVGAWVLELDVELSGAALAELQPRLVAFRVEKGQTYLYSSDGEALFQHLRQRPELSQSSRLTQRKTSLEDVFIHLTGTRLSGDLP